MTLSKRQNQEFALYRLHQDHHIQIHFFRSSCSRQWWI